MSLAGILLGLIDIAIYVAIMILVGLIVVWLLSFVSITVPEQIKKIYLIIVVLIALAMLVALILGGRGIFPRIIGEAPFRIVSAVATSAPA